MAAPVIERSVREQPEDHRRGGKRAPRAWGHTSEEGDGRLYLSTTRLTGGTRSEEKLMLAYGK
ncbi:hypothetical protein ACFYZJ_35870 [Streptomyces sp. NPDC001848]|uniref:hypothetical protein n=1 Tax=Streptomyces sp. NPDC001848 TaxID=3364618 RepID=UPI0036B9829D